MKIASPFVQELFLESTIVPQSHGTRVAVVIVNWRQALRTIALIEMLKMQTIQPSLVIVVDNGSGDDSISQLSNTLLDIVFIPRLTNGGFGAGCNTGIEFALSHPIDYVWLLNNDAMPEASCLEHLLEKAVSDQSIGAVGSCIREPKGAVPDHAGTILNPLNFNCRYSLSDTEFSANTYSWITGASILLSSHALRKVGIFDTKFFMYWEDSDLCCRIRRANFKLAIAVNAIVVHEAGTSSNHMKLQRYQWHLESQLYWVLRNYSFPIYGTFIIYLRTIIKSIISNDWKRLALVFNNIKDRLF
jgi:GT2 family glycosyltransferase